MAFSFDGAYNNDRDWRTAVAVPDGNTVTQGDVGRVFLFAAAQLMAEPNKRIATVSEQKAIDEARAIPDGWSVTLDAVNTTICDGVYSWSRTYQRGEQIALVPCAQDGSSLPATRQALLAIPVETVKTEPTKPIPEA